MFSKRRIRIVNADLSSIRNMSFSRKDELLSNAVCLDPLPVRALCVESRCKRGLALLVPRLADRFVLIWTDPEHCTAAPAPVPRFRPVGRHSGGGHASGYAVTRS